MTTSSLNNHASVREGQNTFQSPFQPAKSATMLNKVIMIWALGISCSKFSLAYINSRFLFIYRWGLPRR